MHRPLVTLSVIVMVAAAVACDRAQVVRRIVRPEGEVLSVTGKYTIVILSPVILQRTFGPRWEQLSLFYSENRGITEGGVRAALATSPLRPLAKGLPILLFSGDQWPDLVVLLYALETRRQATFAIDTTKKGSITEISPAESRAGEPEVGADGRLFFR